MWPYRPERLTDVVARDDLRWLLQLGDALGSAVSLVEKASAESFESIDPPRPSDERRADPFCTYFRHGKAAGKLAFDGADEACTQCEQRFARRVLSPAFAQALTPGETGAYHLRCHMGLTDWLVPVSVGGKPVAGLIAGRRVESDDDRQRIRKIVGKLGKLTRAEAESAGAQERLITPADEKARDRLLQEIASIPLRSEELERKLAELARLLGRFAARHFEGARRAWEDGLVERIDSRRHADVPESFADLRRDVTEVLDALRAELEVEFIAFFAVTPKELDDREARASLVAESGLGANTSKRILELDWSKLPPATGGGAAEAGRGQAAVSAAARTLLETRDSPPGLKDALTRCLFLAPVEFGGHLHAALAFGRALSPTEPETVDYQFLARLGRAVARNYYALAAEIERRWLASHLEREGTARKEAEAARRQLERTEGFTFFDARKLLNQCLERAEAKARERGVEVDTRELIERVTFRGDRQQIAEVFRRLLDEGIERTLVDPESKKSSPLRVFLKRSRTRLFFGVEAIGDLLGPAERRDLFAREPAAGGSRPDAASEARADASSPPGAEERSRRPSLGAELAVLRRHEGRLRVDSERLHRWERDRNRWIGKTTFFVDLPLPVRPEAERPAAKAHPAERPGRLEKPEKPERSEKPERPERPARRPDKQPERPEEPPGEVTAGAPLEAVPEPVATEPQPAEAAPPGPAGPGGAG
ncbi:MAG: PocR ligand-binding domain-containing protein [Planctomycetes bacterium]|nr:PocR ligand-binding domain-containing protein [Planctomycetota bacterium]